jgi:lambda family phage tail tape measure protein
MAKTIDELGLKITISGTAQVKDAADQLDNLGNTTTATGAKLNAGAQNMRNVAFQVQDMAVQIAGGTSAFVAMGQQLPQLLGGFGLWGAAIGALAAVAIPLARVGLTALGVDMRNLDERLKDLTDSTKKYQDAQRANQATLEGLGTSYGNLTASAKRFFDIQEQITKQKALLELQASIKEATRELDVMNNKGATLGKFLLGDDFTKGGLAFEARLKAQAQLLGLSTEQVTELGKRMKEIDASKPDQAVNTINDILKYLEDTTPAAERTKASFDKVKQPLIELQTQLLKVNENLKESAQQASNLSTELLGIQSKFQPDINAARRGYDQITALRLEGAQKIAEYTRQLEEKSSKDGVNRSAELAAFRLRTEQDVADKVKDFAKGQGETFRGAVLTNEAKARQLELEGKLIDIQKNGLFAMPQAIQYEQDLAKNAKEYADTLVNIGEQRRKNLISAAAANQLEQQAAEQKKKADALAYKAMDAKVYEQTQKQLFDNMKKAIDDQIARSQKLSDIQVSMNDKVLDVDFAKKIQGMSPYEQKIAQIKEDSRKAALEAGRNFSAMFQQFGEDLTPDQVKELYDGINAIEEGYKRIGQAQIDNLNNSRTWSAGWKDAFQQYSDDAQNSAQQAKTYFDTFARGFEDAIVSFVQTGKLSFKNLANSIIAEFVRIQAKQLFLGLFGGNGGSGLSNFFGALTGKAIGGPVSANTPYIVGERGPELFMPSSAGNIVPNNQLTGLGNTSNTAVTYNINAVDAASFRQMIARDPEFLYAVTQKGANSIPGGRR